MNSSTCYQSGLSRPICKLLIKMNRKVVFRRKTSQFRLIKLKIHRNPRFPPIFMLLVSRAQLYPPKWWQQVAKKGRSPWIRGMQGVPGAIRLWWVTGTSTKRVTRIMITSKETDTVTGIVTRKVTTMGMGKVTPTPKTPTSSTPKPSPPPSAPHWKRNPNQGTLSLANSNNLRC